MFQVKEFHTSATAASRGLACLTVSPDISSFGTYTHAEYRDCYMQNVLRMKVQAVDVVFTASKSEAFAHYQRRQSVQ